MRLEYEGYVPMAELELKKICAQVCEVYMHDNVYNYARRCHSLPLIFRARCLSVPGHHTVFLLSKQDRPSAS